MHYFCFSIGHTQLSLLPYSILQIEISKIPHNWSEPSIEHPNNIAGRDRLRDFQPSAPPLAGIAHDIISTAEANTVRYADAIRNAAVPCTDTICLLLPSKVSGLISLPYSIMLFANSIKSRCLAGSEVYAAVEVYQQK